jgi:hypothetical protein
MKKLLTLQIIFFSVIPIVAFSSAQATVVEPSAAAYEQRAQAHAYYLSLLDFTLSDFCIDQPDVQKRGDVFYLPNEEIGITATSICVYKYQDGQYASKGKLKNGKLDGKHTAWYENGQIKSEKNYSYGKADGKHTAWYENGQKNYELNYKWGKDDGKWSFWHEDGQVKRESNFKDGVCLSGYCLN